jgi:hypothetical protein
MASLLILVELIFQEFSEKRHGGRSMFSRVLVMKMAMVARSV